MDEAFAGDGEVFVDRHLMAFLRRVKILIGATGVPGATVVYLD